MANFEDQESAVINSEPSICKFCFKKKADYTCPRCNMRYCSAGCYKSEAHLECSEKFYKQCFMDGLKDFQTTPEDKQNVLEMLQRLEDENPAFDSDEEDDEADLATRLDGLDLDRDTDKIWEKLTKAEKEEFQRMLGDGRLGNMLQLWDPWWKVKVSSLVEEVGTKSKLQNPDIKQDIPDFSKIFPNEPSPLLPYTVVNTLYGYAYVCRVYNGEHMNDPLSSAKELMKTSRGLTSQTFCSTSEAVHDAVNLIGMSKSGSSRQFTIGLIEDVQCIVAGPHQRAAQVYTLGALSEIHRLLKAAKKKRAKGAKGKQSDDLSKQLFSAIKKTEFLLSWAVTHGHALHPTLSQLELEFCTLSTELASHHRTRSMLESAWGGSKPPLKQKLIEELVDL